MVLVDITIVNGEHGSIAILHFGWGITIHSSTHQLTDVAIDGKTMPEIYHP